MLQTYGANKRGNVATYVVVCVLIAISGSLFAPVMSYYLNTELGFDPIHISIVFALLPLATIAIVQTIARFSDMGLQRPMIICIASLFGIASSMVLYSRPDFVTMCTIGLICLGTQPVAFPQIFASAREFAIKHVKQGSLMFTTFLRSLTSLSWVVGPPLAFAIALGGSFNLLFTVTAVIFFLCFLASYFFLPNVFDANQGEGSPESADGKVNAAANADSKASAEASAEACADSSAETSAAASAAGAENHAPDAEQVNQAAKAARLAGAKVAWWKDGSVMMLFAGTGLIFTAFSSYISSMPLYVTQELQLSNSLPGYIMGLAAFLEIPLMFLGAKLSKIIGLKTVVLIGAISLFVFLVLLHWTTTPAQLLAVQIFPALFIAFLGSIGMVLFQEMLPTIPGQSTSLFINASTAGQIAGGGMISLAESGSYMTIYNGGMGIAVVGVILIALVKKPNVTIK